MLEKTLESPMDCKEIQPLHPKGDPSSVLIGRTDAEAETPILATWCKELSHWKRPWCWERLREGEGDNRGWDGWMASLTQWTWVCSLKGLMLKLKLQILWPPEGKSWLTGKDPDAGKDWGKEKWVTEDEIVGWHHQLNGHEFAQTLGDGEGQGSLACCSPWSYKELDVT